MEFLLQSGKIYYRQFLPRTGKILKSNVSHFINKFCHIAATIACKNILYRLSEWRVKYYFFHITQKLGLNKSASSDSGIMNGLLPLTLHSLILSILSIFILSLPYYFHRLSHFHFFYPLYIKLISHVLIRTCST